MGIMQEHIGMNAFAHGRFTKSRETCVSLGLSAGPPLTDLLQNPSMRLEPGEHLVESGSLCFSDLRVRVLTHHREAYPTKTGQLPSFVGEVRGEGNSIMPRSETDHVARLDMF